MDSAGGGGGEKPGRKPRAARAPPLMKRQIPGTQPTIKRPAETRNDAGEVDQRRIRTGEGKGRPDIQKDYAAPLGSECNVLRESCAGGRRTKVEESINSC